MYKCAALCAVFTPKCTSETPRNKSKGFSAFYSNLEPPRPNNITYLKVEQVHAQNNVNPITKVPDNYYAETVSNYLKNFCTTS